MNKYRSPPILGSQRILSPVDAAVIYIQHGWSVIPLRGKQPTVRWKSFQKHRASVAQIWQWHAHGLLHNIGIVCGAVSQQLVVLDVDSEAGYAAFAAAFPALTNTFTIRTGSGIGRHLYWYVERLPVTMRVRSQSLGGLELLAQGCQIVAAPSIHPETGHVYRVEQPSPVLRLDDLNTVREWLSELRQIRPAQSSHLTNIPQQRSFTSREDAVSTLTDYFIRHNYRQIRSWLNGQCVYPHRHQHSDAHPSFGFNICSGYGFCFVCGTISPEELCVALNISV